jgi:hypothetical protein
MIILFFCLNYSYTEYQILFKNSFINKNLVCIHQLLSLNVVNSRYTILSVFSTFSFANQFIVSHYIVLDFDSLSLYSFLFLLIFFFFHFHPFCILFIPAFSDSYRFHF